MAIFADLVHECVEVYMDDFSVYQNEFNESLQNLKNVLIRCIETNLSPSNEKRFMLLTEGIVLGHHILPEAIKVDRENFRGEISPMGYFSMVFSKKRFANLPFLKPHFAQF